MTVEEILCLPIKLFETGFFEFGLFLFPSFLDRHLLPYSVVRIACLPLVVKFQCIDTMATEKIDVYAEITHINMIHGKEIGDPYKKPAGY